jgi:hypothetical protein
MRQWEKKVIQQAEQWCEKKVAKALYLPDFGASFRLLKTQRKVHLVF